MKSLLLIVMSLSSLNGFTNTIKDGYYQSVSDHCALGVESLTSGEHYLTYSEDDTVYMNSWTVTMDTNSSGNLDLYRDSYLPFKKPVLIGSLNFKTENSTWDLITKTGTTCIGLELSTGIRLGSRN
jgi:hypothetical protein